MRGRRRVPWRRQLALATLAGAISGFDLRREVAPHDEGLMLQAAARIAAGQRPYRDFWANYPPAQPLVLAGMQRALGRSLLHWRVLRVGVDAAVGLLAYRLARRRAPEPLALAAWAGTAGAMAWPSGPGPNPPALALSLGGLLAARRAPLAAGALAGLAVAFRFEIGAAAAAGVALESPRGRRAGALAAAAGTAGAVLAPFLAAAPREMLDDTVGFARIQHLQRLPLPLRYRGPLRASKAIEFYAPAIMLASLGVWALSAASVRRAGELPLAPLALVGAGYLHGRSDEFHLAPLSATLPVMLAGALAAERRAPLRAALALALLLVTAHGLERRVGQALHLPALAPVPGPAGGGVRTDPEDAQALAGLLRSVHALTAPGEPIFVANPRHDLVRAGNPLLYVILDRPNATRYDVMQPGVVTTAAVQREIVAALERAGTRVVVRWLDRRADEPEPNGAGRSSGVDILDRYLDDGFRERERFGCYEVLVRAAPQR